MTVRGGKQPTPKERVVQRQIVNGLRQLGLRVRHYPNGVKYAGTVMERNRQAAVMRADGLIPGFPDLQVVKPGKPPLYGHLEVKREGVSLSTDHARRQLDCHEAMRHDGENVAVVNTLDQALEAVKSWGML